MVSKKSFFLSRNLTLTFDLSPVRKFFYEKTFNSMPIDITLCNKLEKNNL